MCHKLEVVAMLLFSLLVSGAVAFEPGGQRTLVDIPNDRRQNDLSLNQSQQLSSQDFAKNLKRIAQEEVREPKFQVAISQAVCNSYRKINETRLDNVCKSFLEDVVLKLQQDPRSILVIQGYSENNEKTNVSLMRAERVRDYLGSKGVDIARIKVVGKGSNPAPGAVAGNNKAISVWLVPEGAKLHTPVPLVRGVEMKVSSASKTVSYNLGMLRGNTDTRTLNNPYNLPVGEQIHLESIDQVFSSSLPNESFWKPYLEKADILVESTIEDIQKIPNRDELASKLAIRQGEFNQNFAALETAITEFAKQKGYKAVRTDLTLPSSEGFEVFVKSNPPGGKITVIQKLDYLTYKAQGKDIEWRTLAAHKEVLAGPYLYRVEWPGGQFDAGEFEVNNSSDVTLPTESL